MESFHDAWIRFDKAEIRRLNRVEFQLDNATRLVERAAEMRNLIQTLNFCRI